MAQVTSIIHDGILVYQHNDVSCTLVVGTSEWNAWLINATSFIFVHEHGNFTARKERAGNQRGGWYWRAYRKYNGTLHRTYIGKAEELTLMRLNEVAQTFSYEKKPADRAKKIPIRKRVHRSLEDTKKAYAHQHSSSYTMFYSAQPPPIEAILTILINDMTTILDDFVLILDDYQHITIQSIHSAVQFLLDHLSAKMHLVIASRTKPPLSLADLRARSQLHELSTTDLRFTFEETTTFLNEVLQLHLPEETLVTLNVRIEGWVAGLQLAALSLREQEDISCFVAEFTGSHRYIIDYLVEEVLHRQAEPVQHFLLQTSIVERLDASLCNALTSETNGQDMLTLLDQTHLFIVPLDYARKWYRYHALFADVLQTQLHQLHPHWIPELHLKACRWYEDHGFLIEAIDHALAAADFERASTLIEHVAQTRATVWVSREYSQVQRWLDMLPPVFLRSHTQICILYAWVLFSSIQQDATIGLEVVEAHLRDAECSLHLSDEGPQAQTMRGEVAAIFATTSFIKGDIDRAVTCARLALNLLPSNHTTLRGVAARTLVNAYSHSGDTEAASRALGELMIICQAMNDTYTTLNALCNLAQLQTLQGHLYQAVSTYQQAIQLSEQKLKQIIPGWAYIGLSSILLEWNDRDSAAHSLMKGLNQCTKGGDPGILLAGYNVLARLKQAQGNKEHHWQHGKPLLLPQSDGNSGSSVASHC